MDIVFATLVDLMGNSGQNIYSRQLTKSLGDRHDVSLTLICPQPTKPMPPEIRESASEILFVPEKRTRSLSWHLESQLHLFKLLRQIQERPDIIISTLRPSLLAPPIFARRHDISYRLLVEGKIGHGIESLSPLPFEKPLSDVVLIINTRSSERCFVVNSEVEKWINSLPFTNTPITVLPHGSNFQEIEDTPLDSNTREYFNSGFTICYVGSFKPYHCLESLVTAIAQLRDNGLDVQLCLLGDGPKRANTLQLAKECGIQNYVRSPGFVEQSEVPSYLHAADVCYGVIESDRMGSPMKVYEYLSCGKPVIATSSVELQFIDDEDAGILVNEPSVDEIKEAVRYLYRLPQVERDKMGERALECHKERGQTWEAFADHLLK